MATIHDVAKRAGVSIKTVSRVINRENPVKRGTRERIEKAIRELDYTPHRGARSMRSKRTGLVAMITGGIIADGWRPYQTGLTSIPIVHGAQQVFRAAGKTLLFADSLGDPDDVAELVRVFHAHRVEGLVYSTSHHREISLEFNVPFPVVLVNCFDAAGTPAVVPDDELAQRRVVEHMLSVGHRSIGMIGLPVSITAGRLRRNGFLDAALDAGLPESSVRFVEGLELDGTTEVNVLPGSLVSMFGSGTRPTALCFGNDLMAMRALPELEKLGIRPGHDVSIWGFDNDLTICESVQPKLTTISLPYYEMGVAAADTLLATIDSPAAIQASVRICGEIIERGSTRTALPRLVNS